MFARLVSNIFNALPGNKLVMDSNGFARFLDLALGPNQCQRNFASKTKFFYMTKPRYNFPKPSEYKRVTRLGWHARMSTPEGRRILMRRILKGKHVLSH
ncbi:PREDICTED: uncharacterized protein LOC106792365 [Polistes canadensis]|uniref:uncharacterized protein LOC106792365 n=1 Tax=Polistes canadensis TaxID=91411 RepID=UPI000718C596|nr:PREDICTED: uncharacterized protein LOC106792365 [Polistes canadensis]